MPSTSFTNSAGDGKVLADGFTGTTGTTSSIPSLTVPAGGLTVTGGITGSVTGSVTATNTTISGVASLLGTMKWLGATVVAAGTTITTAAAIPADIFVRASAAASTAGVKFTAIATNMVKIVKARTTIGVKVYASGAQIDGGTTSAAITIASNKAVLFWASTPKLLYTFGR